MWNELYYLERRVCSKWVKMRTLLVRVCALCLWLKVTNRGERGREIGFGGGEIEGLDWVWNSTCTMHKMDLNIIYTLGTMKVFFWQIPPPQLWVVAFILCMPFLFAFKMKKHGLCWIRKVPFELYLAPAPPPPPPPPPNQQNGTDLHYGSISIQNFVMISCILRFC